jgi:hypothetical protein
MPRKLNEDREKQHQNFAAETGQQEQHLLGNLN